MAFPGSVALCRVRGLSSRVDIDSGLGNLQRLVDSADVIHTQNVMNPTALTLLVDSGRAVVTVQDHRVFCPGRGKTLVDGSLCTQAMGDVICRECLPDEVYRRSTLELTRRRLAALRSAEVVVLSRYMAEELARVGLVGVSVVPPWVEVGPGRSALGDQLLLGGRLVAHKGIIDGWRAWNEANRPLPLVVAGLGPPRRTDRRCPTAWVARSEGSPGGVATVSSASFSGELAGALRYSRARGPGAGNAGRSRRERRHGRVVGIGLHSGACGRCACHVRRHPSTRCRSTVCPGTRAAGTGVGGATVLPRANRANAE